MATVVLVLLGGGATAFALTGGSPAATCPAGRPGPCPTAAARGFVSVVGPQPPHTASPGPSRTAPPSTTASPTPSAGVVSARPTEPPSPARRAVSGAPPTIAPALPGGCASPGECGFPGASDTGARVTSFATHAGAVTIKDNGQTISGWNLHGSLDIYANDVTVIDSEITSTNWWGINLRPGYTGLRILHDTITGVPGQGQDNGGEDYAVSNMSTGTIEVGWDDMSEFGDVVSTSHGDVHDNYIHDVSPFVNHSGEYQHTDCVISDGGDTEGLVITHNTLLNPTPIAQGASASIGLFDGPDYNTMISDNLVAGGSYAVYGGGPGSTGIKVTNNVFSIAYGPNGGYYGEVAAWNDDPSNAWSGNVMPDGTAVTPSA